MSNIISGIAVIGVVTTIGFGFQWHKETSQNEIKINAIQDRVHFGNLLTHRLD